MEQLNKTKSSLSLRIRRNWVNCPGNILQLFSEKHFLHIASISPQLRQANGSLGQTGCSLKIRIQPNMPLTKEEMKFLPQDKQSQSADLLKIMQKHR